MNAARSLTKPLAALLFPATEPIGERVTVMMEENREEEFTIVGLYETGSLAQRHRLGEHGVADADDELIDHLRGESRPDRPHARALA